MCLSPSTASIIIIIIIIIITHVGKYEPRFIGLIKPIHFHNAIVPAHQDVRQPVTTDIGSGNALDAPVLVLVEHIPSITRLCRHELHKTQFAILSAIQNLLTILACAKRRELRTQNKE